MAPVVLGMCERRGTGHGQLPHVGGYARPDHSWGGCIRLGVDAGLRLGMVARAQNRAGAVRRDLGGDLRVATALRARAECGRGGGTIDLFGGALNMVVKVNMEAEQLIEHLLMPMSESYQDSELPAPWLPARRAELAAALGGIFKKIEPQAKAGDEPSRILPELLIATRQKKKALEAARATGGEFMNAVFSDAVGTKSLQALLSRNPTTAISALRRTPHAIGPMCGLSAPQWFFDWVWPCKFGRGAAYRSIDGLVEAIEDVSAAQAAYAAAKQKETDYRNCHQQNINVFYLLEEWQSRLSSLSLSGQNPNSLMLYFHARELILSTVTADGLHHCTDPAFRARIGEQLALRAQIDDLMAARPEDGVWGRKALVHFRKAAKMWKENGQAYDARFRESKRDPEMEIFADLAMVRAHAAMEDMIATADVILPDEDMRHLAMQDMDGTKSLLAEIDAFWDAWMKKHRRGGGDGDGAEVVKAWSVKAARDAGDTRGVWDNSYSGYTMEKTNHRPLFDAPQGFKQRADGEGLRPSPS